MKVILAILLNFLLFVNHCLHAQEVSPTDSLNILISRAEELKFSQPDVARQIAENALNIANEKNRRYEIGKSNQLLSRIYAELGDYNLAMKAVNN